MSKTILLTRPEPRSDQYATELSMLFGNRVTCVSSPILEITSTGDEPDFTGIQAILFTSPNGVRTLSNMSLKKPIIPCMCVGDKTAIEARNLGCDAFSAKGGADELVQLTKTVLSPKAGPILYIRGETVAGDITEKLSRHGFTVVEHLIYKQTPVSLTDAARNLFASGKIDVLPIFSPMTAKLLAAEIHANPAWPLDKIDVICISKNVRTQLEGLTFRSISTVDTPTSDAMTAVVATLLRS